ncbi:hypothetical protein E5676_scaffold637G00610 [Cucumis melo var. makuwa]|uniref:Uncharacterized protein n=1 Tax=Cucumis melo var. makuwa TaxID=1194695 RepID=A0A5D3CVE4_CUCMM|nr:hypothetical protein E5676_scaffold637G00610 [Cucumis melo var. makuwa]
MKKDRKGKENTRQIQDARIRKEEKKKEVLALISKQVEKFPAKSKAIGEQEVKHLEVSAKELNEELEEMSSLERRLSPKYEGMRVIDTAKQRELRMDAVHKFYNVKYHPFDLFVTIDGDKIHFNAKVISELYDLPNDVEYSRQAIISKPTKRIHGIERDDDIYDFIRTTVCKLTFNYLEEVLVVQKFKGKQLETTRKIVEELQATNTELKATIVQQNDATDEDMCDRQFRALMEYTNAVFVQGIPALINSPNLEASCLPLQPPNLGNSDSY